jgi:hypothetical protein
LFGQSANTHCGCGKWIDEILYGTKVFITPGFIFGETGKRFIRISLCSPVEMFDQALTRLKAFIEYKSQVSLLKTQHMKATIIGLGLIGGSMAIDLRKSGLLLNWSGLI